MARISLEPRPTLGYRLIRLFPPRRHGVMLEPMTAAAHQSQVMRTFSRFRWRDSDLAALGLTGQGVEDRCEVPVP